MSSPSIDLRSAVGIARACEGVSGAPAVVEIEESGLEFRPDPVRPQELLRRVDDCVSVVGLRVSPGEREDVAERCLVLRKRKLRHRAPVQAGRHVVPALRRSHSPERRFRVHITGKAHERLAVASLRRSEPARVVVEVPELNEGPRHRLPRPRSSLDREPHRRDRRPRPAEQLARI